MIEGREGPWMRKVMRGMCVWLPPKSFLWRKKEPGFERDDGVQESMEEGETE